jgi:hypothetical protein
MNKDARSIIIKELHILEVPKNKKLLQGQMSLLNY